MIFYLTMAQITCFQLCAVPGMVRVIRRASSEDLSYWREVLILSGIGFQLAAMILAHVPGVLFLGPLSSALSVSMMLGIIWRFRGES